MIGWREEIMQLEFLERRKDEKKKKNLTNDFQYKSQFYII